MPTYTDIARAAALAGVREVKPYIIALETKIKELEERLHKIETTPNVAQPQTTLSAEDKRFFNILNAALTRTEAAALESTARADAAEAELASLRARARKTETTLSAADERLYNILKKKRMKLARWIDAPAFIVATNKTLRSMVEKKPRNLNEMNAVFGFGPHKMRMYGREFLVALTDNYAE
jgi:superfamily II DNA helicase RecQ